MADPADIAHLLRRTEFVAKPARVAELTPLSIAAAVDNVLDIAQNASPQPPPELMVDDSAHRYDQLVAAYHWWIDSMVTRPRPFQEKMTLFWHGHFTSGISDGVSRVDLMLKQNQLYRSAGMGNLLPLTQSMAVDPAMLYYLSGANNTKGSPNENFARELMELFTLGVGNYAEDDVAASAKAWTGHNAVDGTYVFIASRHDTTNKTFFGTTKNWDGPDIINEILRDNAGKRTIAARYIAKKLWEFFAYVGPEAPLLDDLQNTFLANNLEITPLLQYMLNRPEFYSATAKEGLIRTPTDWSVALCFYSGKTAKDLNLVSRGEAMGQQLFDPPNVAGWKSNGYWLTTSLLSSRAILARDLTSKLRQNGGFDNLAAMSVTDAVNFVLAYFGLTDVSASTYAGLVNGYQAERNIAKNTAAATNLLIMTMMTPEMHTA